jgi:hypothetical protein
VLGFFDHGRGYIIETGMVDFAISCGITKDSGESWWSASGAGSIRREDFGCRTLRF